MSRVQFRMIDVLRTGNARLPGMVCKAIKAQLYRRPPIGVKVYACAIARSWRDDRRAAAARTKINVGYCLVERITSLDAAIHPADGNAEDVAPLGEVAGFSTEKNRDIPPIVIVLIAPGRPPAIEPTISQIVIDPFDGQILRPRAHVTIERHEIESPQITDANPSTAIVLIGLGRCAITSLEDSPPDGILDGMRHAVEGHGFDPVPATSAPATHRLPLHEAG